jgi:hypothetical protein
MIDDWFLILSCFRFSLFTNTMSGINPKRKYEEVAKLIKWRMERVKLMTSYRNFVVHRVFGKRVNQVGTVEWLVWATENCETDVHTWVPLYALRRFDALLLISERSPWTNCGWEESICEKFQKPSDFICPFVDECGVVENFVDIYAQYWGCIGDFSGDKSKMLEIVATEVTEFGDMLFVVKLVDGTMKKIAYQAMQHANPRMVLRYWEQEPKKFHQERLRLIKSQSQEQNKKTQPEDIQISDEEDGFEFNPPEREDNRYVLPNLDVFSIPLSSSSDGQRGAKKQKIENVSDSATGSCDFEFSQLSETQPLWDSAGKLK